MDPMPILRQNKTLKWVITLYFFLSVLGFAVAGMISHQRYQWNHEATIEFYRGNEAKMAYPKLYAELIGTAHVHSFVMPIVFFILWLVWLLIPIRPFWKNFFIAGGFASILIYNAAPFLVRYHSPHWVFLFTVGGVGLFFFYLIPCFIILFGIWRGDKI
jgi:hypothetical protein